MLVAVFTRLFQGLQINVMFQNWQIRMKTIENFAYVGWNEEHKVQKFGLPLTPFPHVSDPTILKQVCMISEGKPENGRDIFEIVFSLLALYQMPKVSRKHSHRMKIYCHLDSYQKSSGVICHALACEEFCKYFSDYLQAVCTILHCQIILNYGTFWIPPRIYVSCYRAKRWYDLFSVVVVKGFLRCLGHGLRMCTQTWYVVAENLLQQLDLSWSIYNFCVMNFPIKNNTKTRLSVGIPSACPIYRIVAYKVDYWTLIKGSKFAYASISLMFMFPTVACTTYRMAFHATTRAQSNKLGPH